MKCAYELVFKLKIERSNYALCVSVCVSNNDSSQEGALQVLHFQIHPLLLASVLQKFLVFLVIHRVGHYMWCLCLYVVYLCRCVHACQHTSIPILTRTNFFSSRCTTSARICTVRNVD